MLSIRNILVIFFISTGLGVSLMAQDHIYLKNKEHIEGKVLEVNEDAIKFRLKGMESSSTWLERKDVLMIVYANGNHEILDGEKKSTGIKGSDGRFNRHVISLNYGDMLFNRLQATYEYVFPSGKVGLEVPFAYSYEEGNYNYMPIVFSGLDFNFYPTGHGKVNYFMGVGARLGMERVYYYSYSLYSTNQYVSERFYYGIYLNNGLSIIFTPEFSITGRMGIGFKDGETHGNGELSVSIRL